MDAGLRIRRRNRKTKRLVSLYDGIEAGMDTVAGRWQTVCEEHGTIISHQTYNLAKDHLSIPQKWCEDCMSD